MLFVCFLLSISTIAFFILFIKEKYNRILSTSLLNERLQNELLNAKKSEQLAEEFKKNVEAISAKIIQQNREIALSESKQTLGTIIEPLQKNISEFKEKVEKTHIEDSKERTGLKIIMEEQIKNVLEASKNIGMQAENLANALKGDKKMQGNWGERILSDILQNAGLQEGTHYYTQGSGLKLINDSGSTLKPDFIIKISDDQSVIIDSKVSISNYEKYRNTENMEEKTIYLKNFCNDIKNHIDSLANKEYQNLISEVKTLNFLGSVMLFIPIEATYYETLRYNNGELHDYAWSKGIVIVGPYNLMPILKVINHLSKMAIQNKNIKEIAELGSKMFDQFVNLLNETLSFKTDLEDLSRKLDQKILVKLQGKGSLPSRAERMKNLGIKTEKAIPDFFLIPED